MTRKLHEATDNRADPTPTYFLPFWVIPFFPPAAYRCCAAVPYGFQSFLLTLLPRIALDDEGNIIILIAFFHENAYVFRCVIAEVEPNEQGLIGKLPA